MFIEKNFIAFSNVLSFDQYFNLDTGKVTRGSIIGFSVLAFWLFFRSDFEF